MDGCSLLHVFHVQLAYLKFDCLISFLARCSLFFLLVTEPGRSEPGALHMFCLVSDPGGVGQLLSIFCAWYLGQVQVARFMYLDQV